MSPSELFPSVRNAPNSAVLCYYRTSLVISQASSSIVVNCSLADKDQQDSKQVDHGRLSSYETRGKAKEKKSNRNVGGKEEVGNQHLMSSYSRIISQQKCG